VIVYKRRIRTFKPADVARIVEKVEGRNYPGSPRDTFPWFIKIMNWAAEAMLSRILGVLGLSDEPAVMFWAAINYWWLRFVDIVDPSRYSRRIMELYRQRIEQAMNEYTRNGKTALYEKLLKDIAGLK